MEIEFVRWLTSQLSTGDGVVVGVGDDAAVLQVPPGEELVVTTDLLCDGTHFDVGQHALPQIGHKALAVNLSDLAAMAATPLAAFVAFRLPAEGAAAAARELIGGMRPLADRHGCPIAGGDTNIGGGPLVIAITALGTVATGSAWRRSGAQPGDRLLVTGELGGSLTGRHLTFEPRVTEALQLCREFDIHAAIDISDGLALDLSRLVEQSGGGAVVDVDRVPVSPAAVEMAHRSGQAPLAHALGDGEDFELLLAAAPDVAEQLVTRQPLACGVTDIGEMTDEPGLHQRDAIGQVTPLPVTGYQHGA